MVPPLPRLPEAPGLVEGGAYFVIHAPRQSGKTTFLRALADVLTRSGELAAVYASCEAAASKGDDDARAQETIVSELSREAQAQLPSELQPPAFVPTSTETRFREFLQHFSVHCPRKVVLLLDEIDAVRGQSLIAILHQLRAGFPVRPARRPRLQAGQWWRYLAIGHGESIQH